MDTITGKRYGFKRKWTDEQEQWLLDHKDLMGKQLVWELFHEAFPDTDYTAAAISSKRTEIGAYGIHKKNWQYITAKPLYSERCKKGYTQIKVSKYEWWSKAKWVWVATHPGEPFSIKNQFMFLDGDNTNFHWTNIRKVDHRTIGIVNRTYGGLKKGDPEANDIFITKIELQLALLDRAEKFGLVSNYGSGRSLYTRRNELSKIERQQRLQRMSPEELEAYKDKERERMRAYYAEKRKDPVWLEKHRKYQAEWQRKKQEKKRAEKV